MHSVTLSQNPKIRLANVRTDCYHLKVLQFLQHFSVILISDASAAVDSVTNLSPCPDESAPLHLTQNTFVRFLSLMCMWWIFVRCFLKAISDQNKCTCTFFFLLATATPPGRVKIDSLASSTRQLRAICSHLGCSSSFCFCDCSSNIIGLKVLVRKGEWRGGTQKWGVAWRGINRI